MNIALLLIGVSFLNLLLTGFVLASNRRQEGNRVLSLITPAVALWTLTNAFSSVG